MKGSIFSFMDFTKPGKDRPEPQNRFVRFWYRYALRFFQLIRLNLLFFVATLPFYVWALTMYNVYIVGEGLKGIALLPALILYALQWMPVWGKAVLVVCSILFWGPANAGLQYVAGLYAAGEHAWAWQDFFAAAKGNWKQGLPFGILDTVVIFVSFYYLTGSETLFGAFTVIARVIWIFLLILYSLGRCYLYPIMVQIDLTTGQLLKNAVLLALIKPWRTLLLLLCVAAIVALCTLADMVVLPLFAYAFLAFTAGSLSAPVIRKYLVDSSGKQEPDGKNPIPENEDKE